MTARPETPIPDQTADGQALAGVSCSPFSCLQCRHHAEYMTHLTATVRCRYPRERAPEVVDMTIFLHGNAVMPLKTAVICPHFEAPIPAENVKNHSPIGAVDASNTESNSAAPIG